MSKSDFPYPRWLDDEERLRNLPDVTRRNIGPCNNEEGIWNRRDQPAKMQLTSELKS
jgi:hypothetical protein